MILTLPDWFIALLAVAVGLLGVGRLARVAVYDDFPPAVWLRIQWDKLVDPDRGMWWELWNKLLHCWWCASFWIALGCIGWWIAAMYVEWISWAWWVFWGALALSYLATMIIVRDQRPEGEE